MDAATKAKLAAAAKAKRARTVLLKDLAAWEVGALIDRAEERGLLDAAPLERGTVAYLSRATPEQEAHLTDRLSRAFTWLRTYRHNYTKAIFHPADLHAIFDDFLTTPDKYIKLLDVTHWHHHFSFCRPKWHSTTIKQPTLDELAEFAPPNPTS